MTLYEAVATGKPFRRPCWVEPTDPLQWCVLATGWEFDHCNINWEDGSTFGDITKEMLEANDFEIKG